MSARTQPTVSNLSQSKPKAPKKSKSIGKNRKDSKQDKLMDVANYHSEKPNTNIQSSHCFTFRRGSRLSQNKKPLECTFFNSNISVWYAANQYTVRKGEQQ